MNIRCAKDVYDHYGIEYPKVAVARKEQYDALLDIVKRKKYPYYALQLLKYLREKDIDIHEFIINDHFNEMQKKCGVCGGRANKAFKLIFYELCTKYKITRLALELCIFPDVSRKYSFFDLDAIEHGLGEALLGIYPFSVIIEIVRRSILLNCEIPLHLLPTLQRFYDYYRTKGINQRGIEIDTSTLYSIHSMMRRIILDLKIEDWKVLDGYNGAILLKNYFEMKRTRKISNGIREYQLKQRTPVVKYAKVFFRTMWDEMGLSKDPFDVRDPLDPTPGARKRTILDTLNLPANESKYANTRTVYGQKRIGLITKTERELFISPCFEEYEYLQLAKYIIERATLIVEGKMPIPVSVSVRGLWALHQEMQGDLVLAFGLENGARPVDYVATNVEHIGEFTTDFKDPVNKRFYTEVVTIDNNVRMAPNKIRPEKKFIGYVFTLACYCQEILRRIQKQSGRSIRPSKYSYMIEKGIPLFVDCMYRRPQVRTITRQYRKSLIRAGINDEKAAVATLYWLRKSLITYARKWKMDIENITQITGSDPKTLYTYYVHLDMIKDTNEKYVNGFLARLGMKPGELIVEQEQPIAVPINKLTSVDLNRNNIEKTVEICEQSDMCDLSEAREVLGFSKAKLMLMAKNDHVKGQRMNNRWVFSRGSINEFKGKYIDAEKVVELLSPNKRSKISKRWAQHIMSTTLQAHTIRIGNKYYTELDVVLRLDKERTGVLLPAAK